MTCDQSTECKYGTTCTLNGKDIVECPIHKDLNNKKAEKIPNDLLVSIGGKAWEKHDHKHVYFNHKAISGLTGLKCIVSIIVNDEIKPGKEMEMKKAREFIENILSAKVFYDLEDGTFSVNEKDFPEDVLNVIKEKINKILGKTINK